MFDVKQTETFRNWERKLKDQKAKAAIAPASSASRMVCPVTSLLLARESVS
jgi:putative component of toxin-antitoxin plasmid stabilization module